MSCCSCNDPLTGAPIEIPMSPAQGQVINLKLQSLNRFHAAGYELCIEDVMETIRISNENGFQVVET